ncbi:MAG: PTS fructose transporter subunit IIC [Anaerostipes sp.]
MMGETKKKSVGSVLYDDVMGGLRPMIPFVAGGGILMALSFMFGMRIGDDSVNQFAKILYEIGHENAMLLMVPIFAGFIAHTIAGQDALAPGMIGGMIAKSTGSGFLGGIAAGFLAGYLVKLLNKLLSNFPEDFQSIKKLLIIPVISTFVIGIVMLCAISIPMSWLNEGLTGFIDGLGTQNLVLTGMVIGGMMAVDLGGPINKVAYTFAVAAISNGNYYPMAAAMAGGVVPPLGVALATSLFKKKFTKDQQIQGKTYYLLGASFITESCMPIALTDPIRMIPAGIIGSAVAGGLAMLFQISLPAPHGGIFVTPVVEGAFTQKLWYLAAIAIGMIVSALIIGFTRKPMEKTEA